MCAYFDTICFFLFSLLERLTSVMLSRYMPFYYEVKLVLLCWLMFCNGADAIYDPVGGAYCEPALRSIAWKGRYLVVGFPSGMRLARAVRTVRAGGCETWGGVGVRMGPLYRRARAP